MLHFLQKLSKKKDKNSFLEVAKRIDGKHIRYVTEKLNDVDEIIGRDGCLSIHDGEFIVLSSGNIVLRTKLEDLQAWELLSLEGAVLTAPDIEHDGKVRTIIAYYKYYR